VSSPRIADGAKGPRAREDLLSRVLEHGVALSVAEDVVVLSCYDLQNKIYSLVLATEVQMGGVVLGVGGKGGEGKGRYHDWTAE
jgi:hypothetical protein